MSAGPPGHHTERHQIMARLDAALASPRPVGPRSVSPSVRPGEPQQDQIYAPVAALQQKIHQQQQARLQQAGHCVEPGLMPHPPGPVLSQQSSFSTPAKTKVNKTEGEEYGFGMQFQVQSNNFYQHQQHQHHQQQHRPQQHPQQHPQQLQQHHQQQHPQQPQQHHPQLYGVRGGGGGHYNPQQYPHPPHDQIMSDMDPTLS